MKDVKTSKSKSWLLVLAICALSGCLCCGGVIWSAARRVATGDFLEPRKPEKLENAIGSRFLPVPSGAVTGLANGVERGFTIRKKGYMVKSSEHRDAYYVALYLEGDGIGDWAVWFVSGSQLKSGGEVGGLAVDPNAKTFSDWGDARKSDAHASSFDKDCIALVAHAKREGFGTSDRVKGTAQRKGR